LRQAVDDHRRWLEEAVPRTRIAVNVSVVQLLRPDFVAVVGNAITLCGATPCIDLEITESLLVGDIEGNIRKLAAVRDLGLSIAIDDFGTGYSSLSYLAKMPVQSLKIDRSFVQGMLADPDTRTLVAAIIKMAHSLDLTVVAEGVETAAQAEALLAMGCDQAQGYLTGKPVPRSVMGKLLLGDAHTTASGPT
jgi:EAL domain-containing protein (putative c-di-GMP-specific phosphodiesterase class I)